MPNISRYWLDQGSTEQKQSVPDRAVRTSKKTRNLGPDRTRTNQILKISDRSVLKPDDPWIPGLDHVYLMK